MIEGSPESERIAMSPQAGLADRGLVLARLIAGVVHEAKNPLHNLALHLQILGEKIGRIPPEAAPVDAKGRGLDRHLTSMRDAVGKVDHLLRAFGDLAEAGQGACDLGSLVARVVLVLGFEARRHRVDLLHDGPRTLPVPGREGPLSDLLAQALLAFIWLANEGGRVTIAWSHEPGRALLSLRADGGVPVWSEAEPHLAALRRLGPELPGQLSIEAEAGGQAGARLSLTIPMPT